MPSVRSRAASRIFSVSGLPTSATPATRMITSSTAATALATRVAVRQGRTSASTGTGCSTADAFFARGRPILPPMLVSLEGVDGSGKSTQAELLREWLQQEGRDVVITREPGGTPLGERVRELLLDGDDMAPWTEAALFAAARAELVERVIVPALAEERTWSATATSTRPSPTRGSREDWASSACSLSTSSRSGDPPGRDVPAPARRRGGAEALGGGAGSNRARGRCVLERRRERLPSARRVVSAAHRRDRRRPTG